MPNPYQSEAEAVAALAATPHLEDIHGVPVVFLPKGNGAWAAECRPDLMPRPTRRKGLVYCDTLDSFTTLCSRTGRIGESNIYLESDPVAQKLVAVCVVNDNTDDGEAGWKDHLVEFAPRKSKEFLDWTASNNKKFEQEEFATFLQAHITDIAAPSGSDVLTFVSKLEETRTVKYNRAINLANGAIQFQFSEEGDAGQKGVLDMFREFTLGIRPFLDSDAYAVKAFLRYRIDRNSGAIVFWYELQKPETAMEDAAKVIIESIQRGSGLPVILGRLKS